MDVDDLDVVVWPESEEREAWWRQVVIVGCADAVSAMTRNRPGEDTPPRVLHAA